MCSIYFCQKVWLSLFEIFQTKAGWGKKIQMSVKEIIKFSKNKMRFTTFITQKEIVSILLNESRSKPRSGGREYLSTRRAAFTSGGRSALFVALVL